MFGLFRKSVVIGLSKNLGKENRHGVVFVRTEDGGQIPVNFVADHPRELVRPSREVLRGMFEQLEKLSYIPISLNILVENRIRTYHCREVHPEMAAFYNV